MNAAITPISTLTTNASMNSPCSASCAYQPSVNSSNSLGKLVAVLNEPTITTTAGPRT